MDIRPDTATVVRDGAEIEVSPEDVQTGETIVVKPGERVPLDGVILTGDTSVNAAALTGESAPVDKRAGDEILSGVINLTTTTTPSACRVVTGSSNLAPAALRKAPVRFRPSCPARARWSCRCRCRSSADWAARPARAFCSRAPTAWKRWRT